MQVSIDYIPKTQAEKMYFARADGYSEKEPFIFNNVKKKSNLKI
jgi:hypothetical protein